MDVMLDTNILERSFKMHSNAFANLFAYLRRTNSKLVLSKLVWDEARIRYAEKLKASVDALKTASDNLGSIQFSSRHALYLPDQSTERKLFEERLQKSHEVQIYDDYSRLDISEIVRRGALRIRPASSNGEELRDVILWLHVLDYAKRRRRPIAFISNDANFIDVPEEERRKMKTKSQQKIRQSTDQEEDEEQFPLHPHLQKDITDRGVKVDFYLNLPSFNKANALRSSEIQESWIDKHMGNKGVIWEMVREKVSARLVGNQQYNERIQEASITALTFDKGTLYKIDKYVQFAEVQYKAKIGLVVTPWPNRSVVGFQPSSRGVGWVFSPTGTLHLDTPTTLRAVTGEQIRHTALDATLSLSVRFGKDRRAQVELDKFDFAPSDDPLFGVSYTFKPDSAARPIQEYFL